MAVRHLNAGQRDLAPIEWHEQFKEDQHNYPVNWSEIYPDHKERMQAISDITLIQYDRITGS